MRYWPLALLLACVVGAAIFYSRSASRDAVADGEIEHKLDRMIELQQKQEARLQRLESRDMGFDSGATPSSAARAMPPMARAAPAIPTLAERMQAKDRMVADLESRFAAQPVLAAWAVPNERQISDFLAPDHLRKSGLPAPKQYDVQCKSSLCRVHADFASDADADATLQDLYTTIARSLPAAQTFRTTAPDGTVQVVVYANPGRRAQAMGR